MAENEKMDALIQNIAELTNTVKEHQANRDEATIDYEKLAGELARLNEQRQQAEKPVRKGEEIPEDVTAPVIERTAFKGVDARDLRMAHQLLSTAKAFGQGRGPSKALDEAVAKAMDTDTAGAGAELLDRDLSPMMWDDIFPATQIANLIPRSAMPTDPYDIPFNIGDITYRKGSQNTATTATDPTTDDATMTSTELVAEVDWSYSLDEDAVIAMMPEVRRTLQRNAAQTIDKFVINADATNAATGNINLDDADPADDSYYLSDGQDGLRHLWLVDNTGQNVNAGGDALAKADVIDLVAKLDKYFQDAQSDVVFVPDYQTFLGGLLPLDEVFTVDKLGPQAVVRTGQLGAYLGVPIIPSTYHPLGEADGKVSTTAGNNTLGSMTAFNRLMWRIGYRRAPMIEVDRDIQKRQFIMVASFRIAVGSRTRSSATHTAGIRNILV